MAGSTKRVTRSAERAEEQRKALELKIAGLPYATIGKQLGCSNKTAWKLVQDALADIPRAEAEEVLDIELQRLEKLWLAAYPKARTGDLAAIHVALKIMERRAKYLGLDAPDKVEDVTPTSAPREIRVFYADPPQQERPAAELGDGGRPVQPAAKPGAPGSSTG